MLVVSYVLILALYIFWRWVYGVGLFPSVYSDTYFILVCYMEMLSILLLRTRISIKYSPKLIGFVNLVYLTYLDVYTVPAALESSLGIIFLNIAILCHFARFHELTAVNMAASNQFIPSYINPRLAYIPIEVGTFHLMPPIWSLVYPPSFLQSFSSDDRKYLLDGPNMPYNFALHG